MLDKIIEWFPEEEFLKADGFDNAIIGVSEGFSEPIRLIYSVNKCVNILMADMTEEDALEHFYFNIKGAYVGEKTPIWCIDDL